MYLLGNKHHQILYEYFQGNGYRHNIGDSLKRMKIRMSLGFISTLPVRITLSVHLIINIMLRVIGATEPLHGI